MKHLQQREVSWLSSFVHVGTQGEGEFQASMNDHLSVPVAGRHAQGGAVNGYCLHSVFVA